MSEGAPQSVFVSESAAAGRSPGAWAAGLVVAASLAVVLMWLLARVVWLPAYFGVFFFLVAGMLVGAAGFRVARAARPMTTWSVWGGVVAVSIMAMGAGLTWEYRYRAATIGEPPKFGEARNEARQQGRPVAEVGVRVTEAFREFLRENYWPGGVVGYIRWAAGSGHVKLSLADGFSDEAEIGHRRWAWVIRSLAAYALFAAGLWYQFEALRSAQPVSNILAPGTEAEDVDL